jgi:hypothetical protein
MTSDGVVLRVSKERLEQESEVFRNMLSVANPNTTDGTEEDPIKVEEKVSVFLTLLCHIYPDCPRSDHFPGDLPSIYDQFSAIRSSIKYLMPRVTTSIADELKSEYWLKNYPGQIYAFACAQDDFPDLIEAASRETLRCGILQVDVGLEGELITGKQYQDLIELHRKRASRAIEIINGLRPFNEYPLRNESGIIKCSCNKDTSGAPLWHIHFCRYAKMELSRAPCSDHIFSGAGVLDVLKDIPCRDCAKSMHKHWYLIQRAKDAIDKLPDSIEGRSKEAADI